MTKKINRLKIEEFIAGSGAGLTNVTLTYPIHKLIFRQMLHGIPTPMALEQLRTEGIFLLYRGVLPPLCQKVVTTSAMFGLYDYYGAILREDVPQLPENFSKSCAAFLAGSTEAILTPMERIQTILSDTKHNNSYKNTQVAIHKIFKDHGFLELYRSGSTIFIRNSVCTVLYFNSRETIQTYAPKTDSLVYTYILDFFIGGVAGGVISSLFYPLNVVRVRMGERIGGNFESPLAVFRTIYTERGSLRRMFQGVHLHYGRSMISWGIVTASYELIKTLLHRCP